MFTQCVRAAARGGRICVAGFTGGVFPQLAMNLVLVKGLTCFAHTSSWPANPGVDTQKRQVLVEWTKDAALRPHISHRFPLTQMKEALRVMAYREMVGRIVMHC